MATYISHANAFRAQAEFPVEAKIKVGKNIWSTDTAGERLYEQVLSKNPATVGKAIDLASELKELPFTPKQTMGHLRWLYTAGQLEVDGKSYVVQAKPAKEPKPAAKAKPEQPKVEKPARKRVSTELLTAALRATAKKPETKTAAMRKRSFVRTKKLAKAA
jgi:hypothetical protein